MIAVMNRDMTMIYREVISKRLERKRAQLNEFEKSVEGLATPVEKRKFIELKAVIQELENVLDIADSMFEKKE